MSQLQGLEAPIEATKAPSEPIEQAARRSSDIAALAGLSAIATTALAACGGGGGGGGGGSFAGLGATGTTTTDNSQPTMGIAIPGSPIVAGAATTIYTTPASSKDAARFLSQASPGATKAQITAMQAMSYSAWLDAQFALPRSQTNVDWLSGQGYGSTAYLGHVDGLDNTVWRKFISSPDLLRQRITMALSEIFVVSIDGLNSYYPMFSVGYFLDVLEGNAFGNYRTLLFDVSRTTAMGTYLTFVGNQLANPTTGSEPDENYAREIMQLFTIGLYKLNNDGTQMLVNGAPVETYTQADVSGLARVFTGWYDDTSGGQQTPSAYTRPMVQVSALYEDGPKTFLGTTIPAGAKTQAGALDSLNRALDTLFNHPNMPPFVGRQLIQRLVTSNPSPAYVNRVANAFINNGSGVRGDLKAVIRQILLDDEARNPYIGTTIAFGKLREPVMRFLNWARGWNATSASGGWAIGDLSGAANGLGQSPMHSPSVFNFFRPGYVPTNSDLSPYNLNGPEFQITNESTVSGYVNFMQRAVSGQSLPDLKPNYGTLTAIAADSGALLDEINLVLAAGELSAATLATLKAAVDTISAGNDAGKLNRVYAALTLVLASPEYIVQK
ncbi:MAG: hypothetical protein JWQ73_3449 [Variovorax sp.]|nr:hypothetical protein [Variovorax sp.]